MSRTPEPVSLPQRVIATLSTTRPSSLLVAATSAMLAGMLLSALIAYWFDVDVLGSLFYLSRDLHCLTPDGTDERVGVHCFGDYYQVVDFALRDNPWAATEFSSNYSAAAMLPNLVIGGVAAAFGAPRIGLVVYLLLIAAAVSVPAIWAIRHRTLTPAIVLLTLFGLTAVPALAALDRGNGIALAVPAMLALLVGLSREKPALIGLAIVLAALIKPQFALLVIVFAAIRAWRAFGITVGVVGATNLLAYLAWPREFPGTILQSIGNILNFGGTVELGQLYPQNVSLASGIYRVLWVATRPFGAEFTWLGSAAQLLGYGFLLAALVALVIWGRRIPPLVTGILTLALLSLAPGVSWAYYLVFALPVAAVLLRDPAPAGSVPADSGPGGLDAVTGRARRVAAVAIVVAVALSVGRILLPLVTGLAYYQPGVIDYYAATSAVVAPVAWIVAVVASVWAWRPRRTPALAETTR